VARKWLGKGQHGKRVWVPLKGYEESRTYNPQVIINC
jgi:hypothetical protein